jgi:pyruvyltransferase
MTSRILRRLFPSPPPVKAYWWKGKLNFGDALAPLLLERFAYLDGKRGSLRVEWSPVADAEVVSVGSVIEHIPAGWGGYIVGSGMLREGSVPKFSLTSVGVEILALRGPLTVKALGIRRDVLLGDPGLLANELIEPQDKKWDLGIVPHWQDEELAERFLALIPSKFSCRVILPSLPPLDVIREIASCRRIVTSSLHGMIVADAIGGIPRRVEYCSKLDGDGGRFKYDDYSASICTPLEFGKMQEPSRSRIDDARSNIWYAYRELRKAYEKS